MSEPSPKVQASADLSPLAPSPVNPAAAPVLPAIQGQAAALEAMSLEATDTTMLLPPSDAAPVAGSGGDAAAAADDENDSISDAYGEEDEEELQIIDEEDGAVPEPSQAADDYAKTFDSPDADMEENDTQEALNEPQPSAESSLSSANPADPRVAPSATVGQPSLTTSQTFNDKAAPSASPSQDTSIHKESQFDKSENQQSLAGSGALQHDTSPRPDPSATYKNAAPSFAYNPQLPQQTPPSHTLQEQTKPGLPAMPASQMLTQQPIYVAAGAPGTSTEGIGSLPPPPSMSMHATPTTAAMAAPAAPAAFAANKQNEDEYQRQWEQFVADERRYMSEARWDRFPDGSRIFIGNLSSDRVSKRDVFELFHKYGRLAQISLKSAYGFVQYHNVSDAQAAMNVLQGVEIRGRKIHLEFSRTQKKNGDRTRSPGEKGGRDREGGGRNRRARDDYRPGRNSSPRRNDNQNRDEAYGRDRGFHDGQSKSRARSRSPAHYGRNEHDSYRRRSPSPYGRSKNDDNRLEIPRRYGSQVPDVQLLLLQEVPRDFIAWVERAFTDVGLKTEVMFLHPNFPRGAVIERQVLEGVHAVVELDARAHSYGKIALETFNRSGGPNKVHFDQYRDLDPPVAAQVVLRVKGEMMQPQYSQPPPPVASAYPSYGAPVSNQQQPMPSFPGMPPAMAAQQPQLNASDLAGMMGQIDNTTLQRLLASIQSSGGVPAGPNPFAGMLGGQAAPNQAVPANVPVDLHTVLGNLKGGAPPGAAQGGVYGASPYGHVPGASNGSMPPGAANTNAQVQNIMAQLAKYRQ